MSLKDTCECGLTLNEAAQFLEAIKSEPLHVSKALIIEKFLNSYSGKKGSAAVMYMLFSLLGGRAVDIGPKKLLASICKITRKNLEDISKISSEVGDVPATISKLVYEKVEEEEVCACAGADIISRYFAKETCGVYDVHEGILAKSSQKTREWILRVLLRDHKLGMGRKMLEKNLGGSAHELFKKKFLSFQEFLQFQEVSGKSCTEQKFPMQPVRPALAAIYKSPKQLFKNSVAEIKYDGERIQIHRTGEGVYSFYSRSLKELCPHKTNGLARDIENCVRGNPKNFVLDGEILAVDEGTGKILPFGSLGRIKMEEAGAKVFLVLFDIMFLDGISLLTTSLKERRQILSNLIEEVPNRVALSKFYEFGNTLELQNIFERAISEGMEGLMIKDLAGNYEPDTRRWLKMKKDHIESANMSDTCDLVIIGTYRGKGKRGGKIGSVLVGSWCRKLCKCVAVCRASSGLSEKCLEYLDKILCADQSTRNIPEWVLLPKHVKAPDLFVTSLEMSVVLEIVGFEMNKNNGFVSIRFPRVKRIRSDKGWKESTEYDNLKNLLK